MFASLLSSQAPYLEIAAEDFRLVRATNSNRVFNISKSGAISTALPHE